MASADANQSKDSQVAFLEEQLETDCRNHALELRRIIHNLDVLVAQQQAISDALQHTVTEEHRKALLVALGALSSDLQQTIDALTVQVEKVDTFPQKVHVLSRIPQRESNKVAEMDLMVDLMKKDRNEELQKANKYLREQLRWQDTDLEQLLLAQARSKDLVEQQEKQISNFRNELDDLHASQRHSKQNMDVLADQETTAQQCLHEWKSVGQRLTHELREAEHENVEIASVLAPYKSGSTSCKAAVLTMQEEIEALGHQESATQQMVIKWKKVADNAMDELRSMEREKEVMRSELMVYKTYNDYATMREEVEMLREDASSDPRQTRTASKSINCEWSITSSDPWISIFHNEPYSSNSDHMTEAEAQRTAAQADQNRYTEAEASKFDIEVPIRKGTTEGNLPNSPQTPTTWKNHEDPVAHSEEHADRPTGSRSEDPVATQNPEVIKLASPSLRDRLSSPRGVKVQFASPCSVQRATSSPSSITRTFSPLLNDKSNASSRSQQLPKTAGSAVEKFENSVKRATSQPSAFYVSPSLLNEISNASVRSQVPLLTEIVQPETIENVSGAFVRSASPPLVRIATSQPSVLTRGSSPVSVERSNAFVRSQLQPEGTEHSIGVLAAPNLVQRTTSQTSSKSRGSSGGAPPDAPFTFPLQVVQAQSVSGVSGTTFKTPVSVLQTTSQPSVFSRGSSPVSNETSLSARGQPQPASIAYVNSHLGTSAGTAATPLTPTTSFLNTRLTSPPPLTPSLSQRVSLGRGRKGAATRESASAVLVQASATPRQATPRQTSGPSSLANASSPPPSARGQRQASRQATATIAYPAPGPAASTLSTSVNCMQRSQQRNFQPSPRRT